MGAALGKSDDYTRFTDSLRIRCPPCLPVAIDVAAARALMTASEYVRRSVIDRLKADGIDPSQRDAGTDHNRPAAGGPK
jgi:hypothetical protein